VGEKPTPNPKPEKPKPADTRTEPDPLPSLFGRRMAMLVRNGTWRRGDANPGAEAVAPAADGDAQPDAAALAAACLTPPRQGQMTFVPLHSAARAGNSRQGTSVLPHPFQTALINRSSLPN